MSTKKSKPEQPEQVEPTTATEQQTAPPADAQEPAERPVAAVWRVCREMHEKNPAVPRAEIIAACLAIGINKHTAQTQIQKFKSAQKAQQ